MLAVPIDCTNDRAMSRLAAAYELERDRFRAARLHEDVHAARRDVEAAERLLVAAIAARERPTVIVGAWVYYVSEGELFRHPSPVKRRGPNNHRRA